MNHSRTVEASLNVAADGTVVIRRKGRSSAVVAQCLGKESDAVGTIKTIYLDRLVHRRHETQLGDWAVSGAVTSILTKKGCAQ